MIRGFSNATKVLIGAGLVLHAGCAHAPPAAPPAPPAAASEQPPAAPPVDASASKSESPQTLPQVDPESLESLDLVALRKALKRGVERGLAAPDETAVRPKLSWDGKHPPEGFTDSISTGMHGGAAVDPFYPERIVLHPEHDWSMSALDPSCETVVCDNPSVVAVAKAQDGFTVHALRPGAARCDLLCSGKQLMTYEYYVVRRGVPEFLRPNDGGVR